MYLRPLLFGMFIFTIHSSLRCHLYLYNIKFLYVFLLNGSALPFYFSFFHSFIPSTNIHWGQTMCHYTILGNPSLGINKPVNRYWSRLIKFILCHCGHYYSYLDLFSITLLFTELINKLVFYIQGFQ